jgi:glutamyl/glutaminyl-tRNA synthetase
LTAERRSELEVAGAPRAVRFKVPKGETGFDDLVHGRIAFDNANIEDFVALRSDGLPTYHLSVVADDIDMQITHVVRGDDHISNTPKQLLIYEALGQPAPKFAHVPLILGPDRKRLSKRHGATSVTEYQRQGYVSEAMVNFLALLEPRLREKGLWRPEYAAAERPWLLSVIALLKPRVRRLDQFLEDGAFFFNEALDYDTRAVAKYLSGDGIRGHLEAFERVLKSVEPFAASPLESGLRSLAAARGVKPATLIHATRVAVTGRAVSPGLFEVLELLGRERCLERLRQAMGIASA